MFIFDLSEELSEKGVLKIPFGTQSPKRQKEIIKLAAMPEFSYPALRFWRYDEDFKKKITEDLVLRTNLTKDRAVTFIEKIEPIAINTAENLVIKTKLLAFCRSFIKDDFGRKRVFLEGRGASFRITASEFAGQDIIPSHPQGTLIECLGMSTPSEEKQCYDDYEKEMATFDQNIYELEVEKRKKRGRNSFFCHYEDKAPALNSLLTAEGDLCNGIYRQILHLIDNDKSLLFRLEPRAFEVLIFQAVRNAGYKAKLTRLYRDGGYDLMVSIVRNGIEKKILIECKKYAPDRPVSVEIVRAFYGVVKAHNCTSGVLFSTSNFTTGANEFQEIVEKELSLLSFANVLNVLNHGVNLDPVFNASIDN